jgi:hypothetical protein
MADSNPSKAAPVKTKAVEKPKSKPSQPLPTNRMSFDKQIELLRAWGTASGAERKAVTNKAVADMLGMNESSSFLMNTFFQEVGFLSRGDGGLIASPEVVAYVTASKWGDKNAPSKLSGVLRGAWFSKVLMPKLGFRDLDESQAILDLGAFAGAEPEYRGQVKTCIEYLEFSGLVQRDGNLLKEGPAAHQDSAQQQQAPPPPPTPPAQQLPGKPGSGADGDNSADVTAEALTRLLKGKPPKNVQQAIWTLIQYLTIGKDAFTEQASENGGVS